MGSPIAALVRGEEIFIAPKSLPHVGQIPPIRGKCPEGTKGVGTGGSRRLTDEEKGGTF